MPFILWLLRLIVIFYLYRLSVSADGQEFFTSYDEVCDTFDAMGLQENLLRGIYAYGKYFEAVLVLQRCDNGTCLLKLLLTWNYSRTSFSLLNLKLTMAY